uniref:DUF4371 domain-containing protein n=1 Tax=Cajanus cajan TaxID=3821 RepID=A0A151QUK9_CAJCA|nr:hypothetical protein KK1_045144 [Cajanus cajan]
MAVRLVQLEYSQKEDATYCLYCYLMRSHVGEHKGSGDVFITEGFTNWKKPIVVVLRYVNKKGQVIEHFLGLVHVSNTNILSLKIALESLFSKYGLSLSRLHGQWLFMNFSRILGFLHVRSS